MSDKALKRFDIDAYGQRAYRDSGAFVEADDAAHEIASWQTIAERYQVALETIRHYVEEFGPIEAVPLAVKAMVEHIDSKDREIDLAESERIEWVKRGEQAEERCSELQGEIERLEETVAEWQHQVIEACQQANIPVDEKVVAPSKVRDLGYTVTRLEARVRDIEEVLAAEKREVAYVRQERDALKAKLEQVEEELRQMTLSNHFRAEDTLKLEAKLAMSEQRVFNVADEVLRIRNQGESSSDFGIGCMAACDDMLTYLQANPAQETP